MGRHIPKCKELLEHTNPFFATQKSNFKSSFLGKLNCLITLNDLTLTQFLKSRTFTTMFANRANSKACRNRESCEKVFALSELLYSVTRSEVNNFVYKKRIEKL